MKYKKQKPSGPRCR